MDFWGWVLAITGAFIVALLTYLFIWPLSPPRAMVVEPNPDNELVVGVMPFGNVTDAAFGPMHFDTAIRELIESALPNFPGIKPFTRSDIDFILQEQKLYFEGLIDPRKAIEIGMLTPIEALVTGQLLGIFVDNKETEHEECQQSSNPSGQRSCRRVVEVSQNLRVQLTMQVIDTKTGEILVGDTFKPQISRKFIKGSTPPTIVELALEALTDAAKQIARKISNRYTRAFHYGTFKNIVPKWLGIEGAGLAEVFNDTDTIIFLMHFSRIRQGDVVKINWIDPEGTVVESYETTWRGGEYAMDFPIVSNLVPSDGWGAAIREFFNAFWPGDDIPLYYPLIFTEKPTYGLWRAEVLINGASILEDTFIVRPEPLK